MKHALKLFPVALLTMTLSAQAAVTITIQEIDGDVVVAGSGAINSLAGLTLINSISSDGFFAQTNPSTASIGALQRGYHIYLYEGHISPQNFGGGKSSKATIVNSTGFSIGDTNVSGVTTANFGLGLPASYVLGSLINFVMTYEAKTLDDLGIIAGTYEWKWGTAQDGANGDSVILNVIAPAAIPTPAPVPTLSAFGLMGLAGVIGAAGVAMTRRRKK